MVVLDSWFALNIPEIIDLSCVSVRTSALCPLGERWKGYWQELQKNKS
jgi:hypothetical protein